MLASCNRGGAELSPPPPPPPNPTQETEGNHAARYAPRSHYLLLKNPEKIFFLIKGNMGLVTFYSFGVLKQIVGHVRFTDGLDGR